MIYTYDNLADECLELLGEASSLSSDRKPKEEGESESKSSRKDSYVLLREGSESNPKLKELWSQVNSVPEWVDWDQISRGQDVFYRYGLPILNTVSMAFMINMEREC